MMSKKVSDIQFPELSVLKLISHHIHGGPVTGFGQLSGHRINHISEIRYKLPIVHILLPYIHCRYNIHIKCYCLPINHMV